MSGNKLIDNGKATASVEGFVAQPPSLKKSRSMNTLRKKQPDLIAGDIVLLPTHGTCRAWVRYVGALHFASGLWIGVELLDPKRLRKRSDAPDKMLHSGEVGGVRYFTSVCPNSSIFVRRSECLLTGRPVGYPRQMQRRATLHRSATMALRPNAVIRGKSTGDIPSSMVRSDESLMFHSIHGQNQSESQPSKFLPRSSSWDGADITDDIKELVDSTIDEGSIPFSRDGSETLDEDSKSSIHIDNKQKADDTDKNIVVIEDNLDLEHLSDLVDGLREARDEALHHLEIAERTLDAERLEHEDALKAKDREIFFLKSIIRRNIHSGLGNALHKKNRKEASSEGNGLEDKGTSSPSRNSIWFRRKSSSSSLGIGTPTIKQPVLVLDEDGSHSNRELSGSVQIAERPEMLTPDEMHEKVSVIVKETTPSTLSQGSTLLQTGGFGIDEYGIVSTPKGSYKRDPVETPGKSVESDLLRLGYLGRGAGGIVYKSIHMPTLRICAMKCVSVYDAQHRDQLVSEIKALRSNLVSWQYETCAGCGKREHDIVAQKGTPRRCILCAKLFCGEDKHAFMTKTGHGHGTWKCKDDCEVTMFDDTVRVAKAAMQSVLASVNTPSSVAAAPKHSLIHRLFTPQHRQRSHSLGFSTRGTASVNASDKVNIYDQLREALLSRSASKLSEEQRHLIRQLLLSAMAEKRGAKMPHLVELYQVFTSADGAKVNIVMEFMDGGSLEDLITSSNSNKVNTNRLSPGMDISQLKSIARQCLGGLALLHRKKLLHRDIKPANILLKQDGQVKLADFGIAAQAETNGSGGRGAAVSGEEVLFSDFVGTMAYMAPERLKGSSTYSFPSDIWSLGLSLYVAAVGTKPWPKGLSELELITTIIEGPPPALDPTIYPSDLCNFIGLCLQMNPANRPSASGLLKHPFLKINDDEVKKMVRRRSSRGHVGSSVNQKSQRRLDSIIEHLFEHFHNIWINNYNTVMPMPSFDSESVESLASQLGVWPLTALRKFQKLEHRLMMLKNEIISERAEETRWPENVDLVSMPTRPCLSSNEHVRDSGLGAKGVRASSSVQSRESVGRFSVEGLALDL